MAVVETTPKTVIKRNGKTVQFDSGRIVRAILKCAEASGITGKEELAEEIASEISSRVQDMDNISVKALHNMVELLLQVKQEFALAKQYILFRAEKDKESQDIPDYVRIGFSVNDKYFDTDLQKFQMLDKFARYDHQLGRRENWEETVDRVVAYFKWHCNENGYQVPQDQFKRLAQGLLKLKATPSMRCVQMAGPALQREQLGVFNCAFLFLDSIDAMAEDLYVLMQGTGVGFSVEREYTVENFPRIKRQKKNQAVPKLVIPDTTEGWCDAYKEGLFRWMNGLDVEFDYSRIRPAGSPLKTKGGRASGPEPLKQLLTFARNRILQRQGNYLTSLDLHDITCCAHWIVKMGGVRRASGISLSDLDDQEMRDCKSGTFWNDNKQRNQANNSAVYIEKPTQIDFMKEWMSLINSNSGERGIFNRGSLTKRLPRRRDKNHVFGTNPCGEVILRDCGLCNLSIAVIRPEDTLEDMLEKVELATIWGTLQSTMTNFKYVRPKWKKNAEEERLLGVDLLGFLDHPLLNNPHTAPEVLDQLQAHVLKTNKQWAELLEINPSVATTCIKPSGDSSLFFNTAAGFKGWHGKYFIRRSRGGVDNPVMNMLKDAGVPCYKDYDGSGYVLEWPVKTEEKRVLLDKQTAIEQLELWKVYKHYWTEHNPSITVYVDKNEWLDVGHWVYSNWDIVGGLSFMPKSDSVYMLAPYETITEEEYNSRVSKMPVIDWAKLYLYEKEDMTDLHQQTACTGGGCEV